MSQDSIVDVNRPSPGRMYDYYLGGHHNFEVDRQAAEQSLKFMPFLTKYARLQRWALQDIAVELSQERGYDVIIDFASGLPTMDHIHSKVADDTTVIYSDYDPIVVEYTRDILKDTPNTYFFQADARHPEELLSRPEVEKILDGRRKVAFIYWGVSSFLADDEISHAAQILHDWGSPDSCWVFNVQGGNRDSQASKQVVEIYTKLGAQVFVRSLEETKKLIQPWQMDANGWVSLLEWHGFGQSDLSQEDAEGFGPMGGGYGAYLTK